MALLSTTSAAGADSGTQPTHGNVHVVKYVAQDSQFPGPSGSGLGLIFRPYVPTAMVPSTMSNSSVGPNFGQIGSPWMTGLMWNPSLAMTMAAPQQT